MGRIKISGSFCIFVAASLLLLPIHWIIAAVFAASFHELCHWAAIRLCSREKSSLQLYAFGARLPLPEMSRGKELLCTLAGPAGSLTLLLLVRWLPRVAICAALQSVYNLLPVYPMDGGRAIYCLLSLLLPPPTAEKICCIIENCCFVCLLLLGFYGTFFLKLGLLPLLLAGSMILRGNFVKMPCKVAAQRVQ